MQIPHIPVLLHKIKDTFLSINEGYIVDCTLGYGGHSEALLEQNPNIKMICIDQDIEAINFSKERLQKFGDRVIFEKGRFSDVIGKYKEYDIKGILADIGVSSLQLDKKSRGFGFDSETLDMRMDSESTLSAYEVVNEYSQSELEEIFKDYGEVREYKKIAKIISQEREKAPITSSKELSQLIAKHIKSKKIHPATLVFQAIRIEVNDELGELGKLFDAIYDSSIDQCLAAIITFHSLEDRIVKRTFREWTKSCICPIDIMRCICGNNHSLGKIVTKKPIIPTKEEIKENPRSRSSKLRIFKIDRNADKR